MVCYLFFDCFDIPVFGFLGKYKHLCTSYIGNYVFCICFQGFWGLVFMFSVLSGMIAVILFL